MATVCDHHAFSFFNIFVSSAMPTKHLHFFVLLVPYILCLANISTIGTITFLIFQMRPMNHLMMMRNVNAFCLRTITITGGHLPSPHSTDRVFKLFAQTRTLFVRRRSKIIYVYIINYILKTLFTDFRIDIMWKYYFPIDRVSFRNMCRN